MKLKLSSIPFTTMLLGLPRSASTRSLGQGAVGGGDPRCGKRGHAFGGCNTLLNHYRTIGRELRRYERSKIHYQWSAARVESQFREGVAFVPVEVLEAYLEDLLDRETVEERLFIAHRRSGRRFTAVMLAGFAGALAVGLYVASSGASLLHSFALTVVMSLPFAFFLQLYPYGGVVRRLGFAKVLSQEVSRRRGRDKDGGGRTWQPSRFAFVDLLTPAGTESAQGAAFDIFH